MNYCKFDYILGELGEWILVEVMTSVLFGNIRELILQQFVPKIYNRPKHMRALLSPKVFNCFFIFCRLYVISQLPKLKVLDDTAIKLEERELAAKTYERRRTRRDNSQHNELQHRIKQPEF